MRATTALVLVALLVAACGDDGDSAGRDAAAIGPADEELAYSTSYQVCYLLGEGGLNDDTGITVDPTEDREGYALEWGRTQYRAELRGDAERGCLEGLTDQANGAPLAVPGE